MNAYTLGYLDAMNSFNKSAAMAIKPLRIKKITPPANIKDFSNAIKGFKGNTKKLNKRSDVFDKILEDAIKKI